MIRFVVLALAVLAAPLRAQEAPTGPIVRVEAEETQAIPGQPLTVRITVLVPTFMPSPPVWPGYEAPNLLVRLPEKSTSPISERIGGQTWSGISRRYQISPMIPGQFTLPEAEVRVTWADPDTSAPIKTSLRTEAVTLTGVLPEGAEGLDPFIAATGLELTQDIEGTPDAMTPGDSVIRTITAKVEGTSPMFLPPLVPDGTVAGLRVYPDEPVLDVRDNRGTLSGTRVERVTYLAEGGGKGDLPGLSVSWYNLATGTVEVAELAALPVAIDGPALSGLASEDRAARLWLVGAIAIGVMVVCVVFWRLRPILGRWRAARHAAWLASERYGWTQVTRAVQARDLTALEAALDLWAGRLPAGNPREDAQVRAALLRIGAARYGRLAGDPETGWRALDTALAKSRATCRSPQRHGQDLPLLNG